MKIVMAIYSYGRSTDLSHLYLTYTLLVGAAMAVASVPGLTLIARGSIFSSDSSGHADGRTPRGRIESEG